MSGRRGIGGTDVGPVVAFYRPDMAGELAKYANATDVALRLIHGLERPKRAVMQRGIDAEPRLRRAFLDAYGGAMEEHARPWIVPHPALPWATCSPDDVWLPGDGDRVLVEIKSTSIFARHKWGEPGSDEIPPLYNLQVQWCLEILDLSAAQVFVGFGRDFEESGEHKFLYEATIPYVVRRDRELADLALSYCAQFQRDFIEPRKLPPLTPVNNRRAYSQLIKEQSWKASATEVQPLR